MARYSTPTGEETERKVNNAFTPSADSAVFVFAKLVNLREFVKTRNNIHHVFKKQTGGRSKALRVGSSQGKHHDGKVKAKI